MHILTWLHLLCIGSSSPFPSGIVHILVMIKLRVVHGERRVGQVPPSYQNRQIGALDETADAPQSSLFSLLSSFFSLLFLSSLSPLFSLSSLSLSLSLSLFSIFSLSLSLSLFCLSSFSSLLFSLFCSRFFSFLFYPFFYSLFVFSFSLFSLFSLFFFFFPLFFPSLMRFHICFVSSAILPFFGFGTDTLCSWNDGSILSHFFLRKHCRVGTFIRIDFLSTSCCAAHSLPPIQTRLVLR